MSKRLIYVFIALGIISLLADITYEGARSVSGAYLNFLAAPAIAAGFLAAGEFLSYLMRFLSGLIVQRTYSPKMFWSLIYIGYAANFAIPLLAFTDYWILALGLFFIERMGKGLRTPVRDVLLVEVSEGLGRGKGFGIHEVLDQVGAIMGPAIIGLSLAHFATNISIGYKYSFLLLGIPVALSLITIGYTSNKYPKPRVVSLRREEVAVKNLGIRYWIYLAGSSTAVAGLMYWGIVSYHLENLARTGMIFFSEIPIFYSVAMVSDALVALPMGMIYDRYGSITLLLIPLFAIPIPFLLFIHPQRLELYVLAIMWGFFMGGAETTMRAAVADLVNESARPIAYGLFSTIYGASMFIGGIITSYLYQIKMINGIILLNIVLEFSALACYGILVKEKIKLSGKD